MGNVTTLGFMRNTKITVAVLAVVLAVVALSSWNFFQSGSEKMGGHSHYNQQELPAEFNTFHSSFRNVFVGEGDEAKKLQSYFAENKTLSNPQRDKLQLVYQTESPHGRYFTYQQTHDGVPIYGSQLKINMDKSGNIRSQMENLFQTQSWNVLDLKSAVEQMGKSEVTNTFIQENFDQEVNFSSSKMIFPFDENKRPQAVCRIEVLDPADQSLIEYFVNKNQKILFKRDLRCFHGGTVDSTVQAWVFMPDPLTTAGVNYGGNYVDNADADVPELNDERQQVEMTVTFDGDSFYLENQYVKIQNLSPPNVPAVTSANPVFMFTRSEQGFEDVNAYYHINNFKQHLNNLGFHTLADFQVRVDPHGANGQDNSFFTPGPPHSLQFGEGGVDDAEDADVVVHEYGHAITYSAAPNTNNGFERQALDEGFGDYIAASYSRSINEFRWEDVFTWDGHNQYWLGRDAGTNKHYPDDLDFSIHSSGEIWSSALMEIWGTLGRFITDRLVMESIYGYATNMTMADAACLLLEADSLVYNGINSVTIKSILDSRGLSCGMVGLPEAVNTFGVEILNTGNFAINHGNLMLSLTTAQTELLVEIFDLNGRNIFSSELHGFGTFELQTPGMTPGFYLLKISGESQEYTQPIVKLK